MEALTYEQLRTNIEQIADIYDFKIINDINEHATLKLTGILRNEAGSNFVNQLRNHAPIQLFYKREDRRNWLFCGVITMSKVVFETDVHLVEIEAKSNTYLLDIEQKSRSFQDRNQDVHQLIEAVLVDYETPFLTIELPHQPINQIRIQYQETDYQFIKRIASLFNQGIVANVQVPSIGLSVGMRQNRHGVEVDFKKVTFSSQLAKFDHMKRNFIPNLRETDFLVQEGSSYDVLALGQTVALNGDMQMVSKATYQLTQGLVEGHYCLQPFNGAQQMSLYNEALTGTSHPGTVLAVSRDQVKVHLEMDERQDVETAVLLPYSTMAASEDGSGWYFMPQPGDQVRVYLPTHDEDQAFASSAISKHLPPAAPVVHDASSVQSNGTHIGVSGAAGAKQVDRLSDPTTRFICSVTGHEIRLTKEGIVMQTADGTAQLTLMNDGNVRLFGQKSIAVTATEDITIRAGRELLISATESIKIECEANSSIALDKAGKTTLKGFEIKSN
ncbi:MAG: phage late control D family protein [Defluviitaleaceae bacterium]|nr:phage late control D family protein [Defluviitaleaceae bacterium]